MAEVTGSGAVENRGHYKFSWTGLGNGDTGKPISAKTLAERSVSIAGTLGSGGAMTFQGSNDGGTNWATLTDEQGTDIVISDLTTVSEIAQYAELVRPNITAGDGTTSIDVHFVGRKAI